MPVVRIAVINAPVVFAPEGFMRALSIAVIAGTLLLAGAQAAEKVPNAIEQEILIKTSLLTLNDANLANNYVVLHARLSKPFRDQFTPDQLKKAFKTFADQKADWGIIAAKPPVPTEEAKIDDNGALLLRGYFDTRPSRVYYDLDFVPSENEWKVIKLNVNVKPVGE
jgi:hypothetical protein